jgi:antitoxin component YwqK of YwqJK toxin-antitoxin module
MAKEPKRPAGLPEEAFWKGAKNRWEAGKTVNGKTVGAWKIWRRDGALWMEMTFNDKGVFDGPYKRYHSNGSLSQEGEYHNGKLDGWVKYYRAEGISSKEPFPSEVYNHQIKTAFIRFAKGKKIAFRYFLANGQEVDSYARRRPDKVQEGAWWNEREYEWEIGDFNENGTPIGAWIWWRYAGTLVCEASYDNDGKLHGYLKRYHDDGTVSREGMYEHGKAIGTHYFHRSENYTQEGFMNNYSERIHKFSISYKANGKEDKREYFSKSGEKCSSKGFPVIDAKVDDLFDGKAERFLQDYYESFLNRMSNGRMKPSDIDSKEKRKQSFKNYWGIEMPVELNDLFDLWQRADHPYLYNNFEPAEPKFEQLESWTQQGKNVLEQAVLEMQEWYPYDYIMDWATGSLCLDSLRQSLNSNSYYHYSYHYGLMAKKAGEQKGQIYIHQHNSYSSWSTSFNEVIAPNLSSFIFAQSAMSAYNEYDLLNNQKFTQLYDGELKENLNPPYYFMNNMKIGNRWLYESDFNFYAQDKASAYFYESSKWIIELLRAESGASDVYYSFYRYNKYQAIQNNTEVQKLALSVPHAFYHLWSCFWLKGYENQLDEYLQICKGSDAIIIRDLALLIEELVNGRNELGIIRDIKKAKAQFNR